MHYPPVGTLIAGADVFYPALDEDDGHAALRELASVLLDDGIFDPDQASDFLEAQRGEGLPVPARQEGTIAVRSGDKGGHARGQLRRRRAGKRGSAGRFQCRAAAARLRFVTSRYDRSGTESNQSNHHVRALHITPPVNSAKPSTPIGNVLRRLKKIFAVSIVFSLAVNLMILVSPLYMMQIYNRVLPSRSESTLIMLTALVVFALAALAILEAVRSLVFVRIGGAVERDLNEIVIDSSFSNMLQTYSTSYDHALRDFDTIRQFVWSSMPANLLDMLWVPLFVLCVFLLHPLLGLIALGGAVGLAIFGVLHNIATRSQLQEAGRLSRSLSGVVERSLRHGQTLQAMGMLEHFKRRWIRERGRLIQLQATAADRSGIFAGVTKSIRILLQTVLLAFGAMLAINDEVSAGVIVAASMLMSRALAPVEATIGGWRQCLAAHGAFLRLNRLLASVPAAPRRMRLPTPRGALQLEDVVVWPPGCSEPTLRKVSLSPGAGRGPGRGRQQRLGQVHPGAGRDRRMAAIFGQGPARWRRDRELRRATRSGRISATCRRRSSCSRARWPRTSPASASSMP